MATAKGLNRIDISLPGYPVLKFYVADGLPSDNINTVYVQDSLVWVGTPAGLTYFNQNKISSSSRCDLRMLDVKLNDKTLDLSDEYYLSHNENDISFEFVGISFRSGAAITYQYKMEGLDDGWHETDQNSVAYHALASGNYKFMLRAINKFGVKSRIEEIKIYVETPWWKTWWFFALVAVFVLALVGLFTRSWISLIKKKEKEKSTVTRQFAELEQQALQAQMNPHFIFNCLNSIQQFIVLSDIPAANNYLTEFARLVRQTLDNSSKKMLTLEEEISYLESYLKLEKMRFDQRFVYSITVDDSIDKTKARMPAMLIQPFVENSIRHGLALKTDSVGHLTVNFKKQNNAIVCEVIDDGVGRSQASLLRPEAHTEYQSRGMAVTKKRIDLINKTHHADIKLEITDLYNEDKSPRGTEVVIVIPQ